MRQAFLVLENGMVFEGFRFGYDGEDVYGELVFNTNMVGYNETLTDPLNYGQIVIQTFPEIGNYGMIKKEFLSDGVYLSGYVARSICAEPSNFRSEKTLEEFLRENNIPGICGVDTRQLTAVIRDNGTMNACICSDIAKINKKMLKLYVVADAVAAVSNFKIEKHKLKNTIGNVAVIDFGSTLKLVKALQAYKFAVTVYPYETPAEEILADNPDGIVLSEGPGNPIENIISIEIVKQLINKKPMIGFGLGHQILALAMGGAVAKLPQGHRGSNQPVSDIGSGKTYITSQNHGFVVVAESIAKKGRVTLINTNDKTVEGIEYKKYNAASMQFMPEKTNDINDLASIFDKFIIKMASNAKLTEEKNNAEE